MNGLEEASGTRLFDRLPKSYALTAAGEILLEAATRMESEAFAAGRGVMGRDLDPSGVVRFTTVDVFAAGLLGEPLRSFHAAYPRIVLDVSVGPVTKSLSRREADVALRPGKKPEEADVIARHISRVDVALYAAPCYLEGRRGIRRLSDLNDHSLVTGDESVQHVRFIRRVREAAPGAQVSYRSDSVLSQMVAAKSGFGVAAIPCVAAEGVDGLTRVLGPLDELSVDAWLAIHRDLRHTARVRAFVDHLAEAVLEADRLTVSPHGRRRGGSRRSARAT
jgi:DNA-binding transcriptional LysR family regulator